VTAEAPSMRAQLAGLALDHLAEHRVSNFSAATHRMSFPMGDSPGTTRVCSSDTFLRAIVADALCDALDAGFGDPRAAIAADCEYLIEQRRRTGIGGWSYFTELRELPSDIDDLAQITQVLVRSRRYWELATYVEPLIDVALKNNVRADGSIRTWLIPSGAQSEDERRQNLFVATAWGDDPDVEVIANFAYALAQLDFDRFREIVHGAAAFVHRCQRPDGSWESSWYQGPYYGTYACSRLLAFLQLSEPLQRARKFLLESQHLDGGWGAAGHSDQLATSLALCSLQLVPHRSSNAGDCNRLAQGLEYLANALFLGDWDAPPFIRMNVNRARGLPGPIVTYGSTAITAAYVLKAAALP
jgi:squalene-hopene/tetraprenyl-beta-curcumene cyclase